MDMRDEQNPGNEKPSFRIKTPAEGPLKTPSPIPEAMRNSWFFQNKVRWIIILAVVVGTALSLWVWSSLGPAARRVALAAMLLLGALLVGWLMVLQG